MKKKTLGMVILLVALVCVLTGIVLALFYEETLNGLLLIGVAFLLSSVGKKYMG